VLDEDDLARFEAAVEQSAPQEPCPYSPVIMLDGKPTPFPDKGSPDWDRLVKRIEERILSARTMDPDAMRERITEFLTKALTVPHV
jgi:hypothetical protein